MSNSQTFDYESLRNSIAEFPLVPGVYIMRDAQDTVLYVGKAKVLRNRVRSYFSAGAQHIKTAVLMKHVQRIEYIVTTSEHEALLLENSLIKRHQPRYNINLKDSKSYPVIRITNEAYPRVFRTRRIIQDGSEYFGPFPNVYAIDTYLDLIEKLFPLRKCRGAVKKKPKPCLYYHIGRCAGVCAGKTTQSEYSERITRIRALLNGETSQIEAELEQRMSAAAESLRYEEAAWCRDALQAIRDLGSRQSVVDFDPTTRDYIALHRQHELCVFTVFQMRGGNLLGSESFRSRSVEDDQTAVTEFLNRYYSELKHPPGTIYCQLPVAADEIPVIATAASSSDSAEIAAETSPDYLESEAAAAAEILIPETRRDNAIMNMAAENARQELATWLRSEGDTGALRELGQVLSLPGPPLRIEGFDIAQLNGRHTVAAMVSFSRGAPDKSQYRRFHIRSTAGKIDDYAAMREAVARRYTRRTNEQLPLPDLILIDGGKGQVNAAGQVLEALDLRIPVIGLAKQFEEIYFPEISDPLRLPEGSPPLRILQHVRDESHRFSTGFNQLLRSKDVGLKVLEQVPGIGPGKAARVLQTFGSLTAIALAVPADIMSCAGIREGTALQLKLAAEEGAEFSSSTEPGDTRSET